MKKFDVVIIGAGPGGYKSALLLGKAGKTVCMIEKTPEKVGGTCLNEGCIPAKNYIETASFIQKIEMFKANGIRATFEGLDIEGVKSNTTAVKDELRKGITFILSTVNVETVYGTAVFSGKNSVRVDGEEISFEKCIIASGSVVSPHPALTFDGKTILSSSDIFNLSSFPKKIAIVGGGAIGCEFATFFNFIGSDVTMIIRGEHLLSKEDTDVSKTLERAFRKKGIQILSQSTIHKSEKTQNGITLFLENKTVEADMALVCTGRVPNTKDLGLEIAGVERDEKGYILVNENFVTTQSHIYAVGDCINTYAYAHTAYKEAKVAAYNIINGNSMINDSLTPDGIFSEPQIAVCGLKEKEAEKQGIKIEIKKVYFKGNAKAKIEKDDSGFIKLISEPGTNRLLGAAAIGVKATEIIHELLIAIEKGMGLDEMEKLIHIHPTIAEQIGTI